MKMRACFVAIVFTAVSSLAGTALAQGNEETLADIRQELSVLYVEVQRLKRELSTTGAASGISAGDSVIERVAAIETELQRLTSKTEQLEFKIDSVVRDGTNRIGDLEFRLCELESGCDIGALGQGTTLGGVEPTTNVQPSVDTGTSQTQIETGPQLAIGEQADFDTAMAALDAGSYTSAAAQFLAFMDNYPGSPLAPDAGLMRGAALEGAGEMTQAARAYLDTFSAAPNGPKAPQALFLLGRALGRINQVDEACVTLGEVGFRFPGGQAAADAATEMRNLGCT